MSQIIAMREEKYKDEALDNQGVKLGFMGPLARASVLALNKIPALSPATKDDDMISFMIMSVSVLLLLQRPCDACAPEYPKNRVSWVLKVDLLFKTMTVFQ